jgi:hypothetical protein
MTTSPAPFELLDDYQTGAMSDADARDFEDELFTAAGNGGATELDFVDRVSRWGYFLAGRGGFDIGSTRARVDELIAKGLRVQVLDAGPENLVDGVFQLPKIDDDAQIVVTHLPLDVRGYDSVDVIVEKPDGTLLKRFRDIGWEPSDGTLYAVCEAPLARISAAAGHVRSTVLGKRGDKEHVIASFESMTAR